MLRFKILVLFIISLLPLWVSGQFFMTYDTVKIEEVTVKFDDPWKYQAGAKKVTIDTLNMDLVKEQNLDALLLRFSPVYVKSDAGGLSTIKLRGLSADHTSVNFGGFNINSLTLGHTNAANIPVYLFDKVSFQYGSASAINGSGSIGGSVYLGGEPSFSKGIGKEIRLSIGSYGENIYGGKFRVGNRKVESKTTFSYFHKQNNFPIKYQYKDFATGAKINYEFTQQSAEIRNVNFLQEFNIQFDKNKILTNKIWFQNSWNEVQPIMAAHEKENIQSAQILNNNIRWWSQLISQSRIFQYHIGIGVSIDEQEYNEVDVQIIKTKRLVADVGIEKNFKYGGSIKFGGKAKALDPEVYAYPDIEVEKHLDIYYMYYQEFFNRLKFTINLRKPFISNYEAPFTPAFGIDFLAFRSEHSSVKILANVSKTYRVPSFNDKYWPQSGNVHLKPEHGMHYETGLLQYLCYQNITFENRFNLFYMNVENWIEWKPRSTNWIPENSDVPVISKGIELSSIVKSKIKKSSLNVGLNSSFNPVSLNNAIEPHILNRQQIYVPLLMTNGWGSISWKKIGISTDTRYVGIRNTDNTGNFLDAYVVSNASASYQLRIKGQKIKLIFQTRNIFNKIYQNRAGFALPGRNFLFTIVYN